MRKCRHGSESCPLLPTFFQLFFIFLSVRLKLGETDQAFVWSWQVSGLLLLLIRSFLLFLKHCKSVNQAAAQVIFSERAGRGSAGLSGPSVLDNKNSCCLPREERVSCRYCENRTDRLEPVVLSSERSGAFA